MLDSTAHDTSTADLIVRAVETPLREVGPEGDGTEVATPGSVFERGSCLGRYVILHALGSGGMGRVFAAYDPELDRSVAIKVLHTNLLRSGVRELAHERLRLAVALL